MSIASNDDPAAWEAEIPPSVHAALRGWLSGDVASVAAAAPHDVRGSSARNIVIALRGGGRARGRPVVIKCPRQPDAASIARINHEAAAMRYLRRQRDPIVSRIAPEIYEHEPACGLVIVEDVARSRGARTLEDVLERESAASAAAALCALGETLGRMHAVTCSPAANGDAGGEVMRSAVLPDAVQAAAMLQASLVPGGGAFDADCLRELDEIEQLLCRGWQAFCHGDINPANTFVSAGGIHLCDFEASGAQHPLLEGVGAGWLFPLSLHAGAVPSPIVREAAAAYWRQVRQSLPAGIGWNGSDATGGPASPALRRLQTAALMTFATYHWGQSFPDVGLPLGHAGPRAKVLELSALLSDSSRAAHFPALGHTFRRLAAGLRREAAIGPDESLPYRSLAGPAAEGPAEAGVRGEPAQAEVDPTGIFRVNRQCHLVIHARNGADVDAWILEHPQMRCRLRASGARAFRAIELPLEIELPRRRAPILRDRRTGKTIDLLRVRYDVDHDTHPSGRKE